MKYQIIVKITDPNTPKGMFSELMFILDCCFAYDSKQYGNGFFLRIGKKGTFETIDFDLRYDKTFNPDNKAEWLEQWAKKYWSGENGAWKIKEILIKKID